ncbi:MAG: methionine aminotransferase [Marinifilaceae bacterium]
MISSKLSQIQNKVLLEIQRRAQNGTVVNLSDRLPEYPPSDRLVALVNEYMQKGYNQYAPFEGIPLLRERIAEKVEDLYGHTYDPEKEITITAGATQAIYTAITALIKEGDEVIIFEPAYSSYVPAVEINGGKPVFVQIQGPDFVIDWRQVQKVMSANTRMIIVNSPHNPTGSVFDQKDILQLQKIIRGTNIIILSDEVYEHIVFNGREHESMARYPDLAGRSLIAFSFGKTYHVSGWEVGYCLGPASLMKEFRKVHQHMVGSVNAPIQYAFADFMTQKEEYLRLAEFYQNKRDYFQRLLQSTNFDPMPVWGSFFQLVDYSKISHESDIDFAHRLVRDYGLASLPVSVFHHKKTRQKLLRFCFAKRRDTLDRAVEILMNI